MARQSWARMTPRQRDVAAAADAHHRRKRLKGRRHATTRGQMRAVIRQITADHAPFSPR